MASPNTPIDPSAEGRAARFFRKILQIRRVEERLLELYGEGALAGTTHACIGQEADAVGLIENLTPADTVFSTHRCHGHYLAYTDDVFGLISELMGKKTGPSGGRGGSQHLCRGNFFSSGLQGGFLATAAGMAFAEKRAGTDNIVVPIIGDGTLGEGTVYEAFNIASLWALPVLFVIENNRYAQSTPIALQLAGDIARRPEAFAIETLTVSSFDAGEIQEKSAPLIAAMRQDHKPRVLILNTYRFCSHSKSDDFRDQAEIDRWRAANDPVDILGARLTASLRSHIDEEVRARVAAEEARAHHAPFPDPLPVRDLDEVLAL